MNSMTLSESEAFLDSEFLNDEFFSDIVEKKLQIENENFKVKMVLMTPLGGKTENFTSNLYRTKIKILIDEEISETIGVVIKVLLKSVAEFDDHDIFNRERQMYEMIVPDFEEKWKSAGEEVQFGPRSLKFESIPYQIIVLDDLVNQGYKLENRKLGIDVEHAKLVISVLAKFHACSAVRYEKDGPIINEFDRLLSPEQTEQENLDSPACIMFMKIFQSFCDQVKSWPDYEEYSEVLDKWDFNKAITSDLDMSQPMKSGFRVLCHADLWVNNFMFKHNEDGVPCDVKLIDFQNCFWGSPANDLLYFMVSSLNDLNDLIFDDLVQHYQIELENDLRLLGYSQPVPSLDETHEDLLEKGAYANLCLMFILFVVKNEDIKYDQLFCDGEAQDAIIKKIYENANYVKAVKALLPFLKSRGFLECMVKEQ